MRHSNVIMNSRSTPENNEKTTRSRTFRHYMLSSGLFRKQKHMWSLLVNKMEFLDVCHVRLVTKNSPEKKERENTITKRKFRPVETFTINRSFLASNLWGEWIIFRVEKIFTNLNELLSKRVKFCKRKFRSLENHKSQIRVISYKKTFTAQTFTKKCQMFLCMNFLYP